MIVSDETWLAIVDEVRARIERFNARGRPFVERDVCTCQVLTGDRYVVLTTEDGYRRHTVARETATGGLRQAKVILSKGRVAGVQVKAPDPKAWRALAGKPPGEIVKRLGVAKLSIFVGGVRHVTD